MKDLKDLFDKLSETKKKLELSQTTVSTFYSKDEDNLEDESLSFSKRLPLCLSSKKCSVNTTQDDSRFVKSSQTTQSSQINQKTQFSKGENKLTTLEECENENTARENDGLLWLDLGLNNFVDETNVFYSSQSNSQVNLKEPYDATSPFRSQAMSTAPIQVKKKI